MSKLIPQINALDRLSDFLWYGSDEGYLYHETEMLPHRGNQFLTHMLETAKVTRDVAFQIAVTSIWGTKYRRIAYTLSSDLLDTIAASNFEECLDLPVNQIRMPYPKMYFLTIKDDPSSEEFFQLSEFHIFEETLIDARMLYFYRVTVDGSQRSERHLIPLPDGLTIREALKVMKDKTLEKTGDEFTDDQVDMFSFVCKLALFLTSTEDMVKTERDIPAHKLLYKPRKTPQRDSYGTNVVVGGRFESSLRLFREKHGGESTGTGSKKTPHMRCGHFHKYHVGVGRVGLKVNWINPYLVNGDIEGEIEIGRRVLLD